MGLATLAALALGATTAAAPTVLIEYNSPTKYQANTADPGIGLDWTLPVGMFDDSGWADGFYGVGYEAGAGAENLLASTVGNNTPSVYTRARFNIDDPASVVSLKLGADYDDGYVAWVNGVEVYRSDEMPGGPPAWNSEALLHESSNAAVPDYGILRDITLAARPVLQPGDNVLAIGAWNGAIPSSDLVLVPRLELDETLALVRGPYLQQGTSNSVVVRWRTNGPTDSQVFYGDAPGNLLLSEYDSTPTLDHEVTLTGLEPDTTYFYSVGTSGQVLAGDDADHFVLTAPPTGVSKPTRIWVLGDSGTANGNIIGTRDSYTTFSAGVHTDLWLMLGDNAYDNGTDSEYQIALYDIFGDMLRKSVLWPAIGNHDSPSSDSATQSGPYFDMFTLPAAAEAGGEPSGTEAYYSFDYGNIHFVVLDSTDSDRTPGSDMLIWLETDLAMTSQDWIIAYWHHPPYSKGSHDSDTEIELMEMRQFVVPILDDYGVDLTLAGHSHSYERSYFIEGHYGDSTTFDDGMKVDPGDGRIGSGGAYEKMFLGPQPHTGIVHTVAGSAGQFSGGTFDHPAILVSFNILGTIVLDVNGGQLDARFLDSAGGIQDHFTIIKGASAMAPIADFSSAPTVGPAPLAVGFNDLSSLAPTAWEWDFDNDGSTDSSLQNPATQYDAIGIYSVKLTASNPAGSDVIVKTAEICAHGPPPGEVTGLAFGADDSVFAWNPYVTATSYDLVKGDLIQLRSSGGDLQASQLGCLADNGPGEQATDGDNLLPGQAFFYLVRANDCAGQTGSFDTTGGSQSGVRDAQLQGGGALCACDPGDDLDLDGFCNGFDSCTDGDGDGFGDPGFPANSCQVDNCPTIPNPLQADLDIDGQGDVCDTCTDSDGDGFGDPDFPANTCPLDNCPGASNPAQLDRDNDQIGNACDTCTDSDNDGFGDPGFMANVCPPDNCSQVSNPGQEDLDGDAVGDLCDTCTDSDGDGFGDPGFVANTCALDNCPAISNATQDDFDGDAVGDVCDTCTDADGDGFGNPGFPSNTCPLDNCPAIANPTQDDLDLDTVGDVCDTCTDTDGDNYGNPGFPANTCPLDNCPDDTNNNQKDDDSDGLGNVCDLCPDDPDNDVDGDTICGDVDNCPAVDNFDQADFDTDLIGDLCDDCTDGDEDGFGDPGFAANTCPLDNCPAIPNATQDDLDSDAVGDVCDTCTDADGDGFGNPGFPANTCGLDNCPAVANPTQDDFDGDTFGDVCDTCTDADFDGFGNSGFAANVCPDDNCPAIANPSQDDFDADTIGDVCDACTDGDGDGFGDAGFTVNTCPLDNCPAVSNPGQADFDTDLIGDDCDLCTDGDGDGFGDPGFAANTCPDDNCPAVSNIAQADFDSDLVGDDCDLCTDGDGDGFGDPGFAANTCPEDNCPAIANATQDDFDADAIGDVCDTCTDTDNDGWGNPGFPANTCFIDNCPDDMNVNQMDRDSDGLGNVCDLCPDDPDNDIDGDTICGDVDNCPAIGNFDQADFDADLLGDVCDDCTDGDGDAFGDPGFAANSCPEDNCPALSNPGQADFDNDLIGDACDLCTDGDDDGFGDPEFPNNTCPDDNCPTDPNPGQSDLDSDTIGDACDACDLDPENDLDGDTICGDVDNCPAIGNLDQADFDADLIGDVCDDCTDGDNDGFGDPGFAANNCTEDNCPADPNPGQADVDNDLIGDVCDVCELDPDNDIDGDTVCGDVDNCPVVSNLGQGDLDSDLIGDACDDCTDSDGDGFGNPGFPANTCPLDNCPDDYSPAQKDFDSDGIGDVCDLCIQDPDNDSDGDTICGNVDNCPFDANLDQANFDGDAEGDVCDPDDDNDGTSDTLDCADFSPGVSLPPERIGPTLRMGRTDRTLLRWLRGFQGHAANVYRAVRPTGTPWSYDLTCLAGEVLGTDAEDLVDPPAGTLVFYLVGSRNACGDSVTGLPTSGPPIVPTNPCALVNGDFDTDGIPDLEDNCAGIENASQADGDGDFVGNLCDNCPNDFNPDQANRDGDGLGDACDPS